MFPVPKSVATIEGDVEAKTRDFAIDIGQSPPQSMKYIDVTQSHWDAISARLGYAETKASLFG